MSAGSRRVELFLLLEWFVFSAVISFLINPAHAEAYYNYHFDVSCPKDNCFKDPRKVNMFTEVSGEDDHVDFTIYNENSFRSSISRIYFDLGSLADDFPSITITNGPGTDFIEYFHGPRNLPGWRWMDPPFYADISIGAKCPVFKNGINPNEWVKVGFDFPASVTIGEVIDELNSGDIRVGVRGLPFCSKELDVLVVPDPATICLLGLGGIGLMHRKITRVKKANN